MEMGKHADLLAIPNGVYRRMWETQNLLHSQPTSAGSSPSFSSEYISSATSLQKELLDDELFHHNAQRKRSSNVIRQRNQEFRDHLIALRRSRVFNPRSSIVNGGGNDIELLQFDRMLLHNRISDDDFTAADNLAEEESIYSEL